MTTMSRDLIISYASKPKRPHKERAALLFRSSFPAPFQGSSVSFCPRASEISQYAIESRYNEPRNVQRQGQNTE